MRYSLSQADFAEFSKIGKASLARWESGMLIQNQANDNLLYLLTFPDNFERLKARAGLGKEILKLPVTNVIPFHPKFREIPTSDVENLQREAGRFELYQLAHV